MDQQTATAIQTFILAGGIICWLVSVWLHQRLYSSPTSYSSEHTIDGMDSDEAFKGLLRLVVPGAKVLRNTDSRIEITKLGATGSFEVERAYSGTVLRVEWDSAGFTRWFRLGLSIWTFVITPLALGGISFLIWRFVVQNPNPQIRWQVFQMFQIVHFLWPPFLIYFIHRGIIKAQRRSIENIHLLIKAAQTSV